MGCINSKVIGRSMSIRDDLSWEELLITSQSGTDQLFALVCSTTNKPRTSINATALPSTEISTTTGSGSRSFHTVEEYDALLENVRKFSTQQADETAGWKRKAVAKGLKPLQVSTTTATIEFPESSSWQREQVDRDSPGTYVTPRFGSYNSERASSKTRGEKENSAVFSRELVTAFEDCMKQLRDDEASILWEMDAGCSENRD